MQRRDSSWSGLSVLLGLAAAVPLVVGAVTRGLWAPDEPRYAEVARELFEGGNGLVMRLCGDVYPDKPPLLFWCLGLVGWLSDWSVAAMRVVPIAATLGSAWLVGRIALSWWGPGAARWTPAIFLGTAMVTEIGSRLQIDPLLTLCTTGAIACLAVADADVARARRRALLAALLLGLGGLAKGPVAWLDGLVPLLLWRGLGLAPARPRLGGAAWAGAAALLVLPVAAWAGLAAWLEPELFRELFFGQHVGRAIEGKAHAGPLWKHLERMPLLLLPWTVPVLLGLRVAWRGLRAGDDRGAARAGAWLVGLFVVFSVMPTKRDLYLLPAYPAAALLAARWLDLTVQRARGVGPAALVPGVLFGILGVGLLSAPLWLERVDGLPEGLPPLAGRALLLGAVACASAVWILSRRADPVRWGRAVVLGWAALASALFGAVYPVLDPYKSARVVALELAERPERPLEIPTLGVKPEGYRFYGRVPTVSDRDLVEVLEREGSEFLALSSRKGWERLDPDVAARFRILYARTVGGREVLILGAAGAERR